MLQVLDKDEQMTPEQFIYWLQGFFEMTDGNKLTDKQVQIIRDHLQQVFCKNTPDRWTYNEPPKAVPDEGTGGVYPPVTFIC